MAPLRGGPARENSSISPDPTKSAQGQQSTAEPHQKAGLHCAAAEGGQPSRAQDEQAGMGPKSMEASSGGEGARREARPEGVGVPPSRAPKAEKEAELHRSGRGSSYPQLQHHGRGARGKGLRRRVLAEERRSSSGRRSSAGGEAAHRRGEACGGGARRRRSSQQI